MSWNYRVVRHENRRAQHEDERYFYEIHEAYYDDTKKKPHSITVDAITVSSETVGGLRWALKEMLKALDKPVIDYETRDEIL